jgi:signal transduction histidine kinase
MEWWFRILMGLLAAGLVTLIIFFIIRSAVRRNANRTAFMNVLPDLLLRLNKQGKYIDFLGNKEPLPVPFGQMKGKFPSDILPGKLATLIDHHHSLALNTQTLQVFDYTDVQMDGRAIDYEGRMISVNRSEVLYIIRDVTERKKAEREVQRNQAELLELLDQKNELIRENKRQQMERLYAIVETQETERQRVANDLHDGIAQMLSLIKINLSAIDDGQDNKERQQQVIDATQKLVDSINADLRNISHNLMPASLSRFGLIPALKELAERMQHNKQLNFRFSSHTASLHFDPMIDVNIYRIVQELINNTIKHGRASHILLQVLEHEDSIALTFENDGISYDPVTGENKDESRGLKNILTRVRTMNGMIQFDTAVSGEIVVTLEVPLPAQHPPKTNTYG